MMQVQEVSIETISIEKQMKTSFLFYSHENKTKSLEEDNRDKGKLYKPQVKHEEKNVDKLNDLVKFPSSPSANASKKDASGKKIKTQEKKKSNLELFKEELRK